MARAATALVPLVLVLPLAGCAERVVVSGIDASEARRCGVVLRAAGLDVSVERDESAAEEAHRLVVRGDDADYRTALRVLEEHALPRRRAAGFSTESSTLIPSPTEERARFIKGLSGEIEAMLESVDGVVTAEAVVSLPERRPLAGPEGGAASASVVVAHAGDRSPVDAAEVREIVVRAVGGTVSPADVAVVLKPAVRPGTSPPVVRYERDRAVETAFLVAVLALAAAECATVWMLRRARLAARGAKEAADGR